MNNILIRLTESDLHKIVKEAVNSILTEVGETDSGQDKLARLAARKSVNGDIGYFDVSDYAKEKRNGNLKKQDIYAKAFHKEKDRLKNGGVK
jgi:formate-dependent nitrite reductase cytochrome c552 subunit